MKFEVAPKLQKADTLVVAVFEKSALAKQFKNLPKELEKLIQKRITAKDFEAKAETSLTLFPEKFAEKLILVGLGEKQKKSKKNEKDTDLIRRIGAIVKKATEKSKSVTVLLPEGCNTNEDFEGFIEGYSLGGYKFEKYFSKKADKSVTKNVVLVGADKSVLKRAKEMAHIADSVFWVRDLINTPAGDMSPKILEKEARKLSKLKNIKVKVLDYKKLKQMKAGGICAVGQGAEEKSRMVIFEYKNKPRNKKPMAFIGKGVCFDTGGLNIKPTRYIEDMKLDMSGAATVIGIFNMLGKLQPKLHVVGAIGVVENAVSEKAYRPGDVIKALNGKTIEVLNTDAEGRLVLADCLTYIEKQYKPGHMMDFATLTGAALYTTGHDITPILGNDQDLVDRMLDAGKKTDEIMWQLPLYKPYAKALKGSLSDLNNTGDGVKCGTITATLFLQNFINNDTPWMHCDIAGTAHGDKADGPYKPKGGRGVLLRALWEFLSSYK